jgi:hypothetical protein
LVPACCLEFSFVFFVKPGYPSTIYHSLEKWSQLNHPNDYFISKQLTKVPTLRLKELNNNQIFVATTRVSVLFLEITFLIVPTKLAYTKWNILFYVMSDLFSKRASLSINGRGASYAWVNEPEISLYEDIFLSWCAFCQPSYRVIQYFFYLKVVFSLNCKWHQGF